MKSQIKKQLKRAGFEGKVYFRKSNEFGKADNFGPAVHRRWIDPSYEINEVMYSVERDGFETVVVYLEPKSFYTHKANLENPKHVWDKQQINGLRMSTSLVKTAASIATVVQETSSLRRKGHNMKPKHTPYLLLMWLSDEGTMGRYPIKNKKEAKALVQAEYNRTKISHVFGQIVCLDDSRIDVFPKKARGGR